MGARVKWRCLWFEIIPSFWREDWLQPLPCWNFKPKTAALQGASMPAAGRLRRAPPSQIQITFTRRAKDQFSKGERRGGRGRSAALRAGAAASRGGRRGVRAAAPLPLPLPGAAGRGQRAPFRGGGGGAPPGRGGASGRGVGGGDVCVGPGPSGGPRRRGRRAGSRRRRRFPRPRPPPLRRGPPRASPPGAGERPGSASGGLRGCPRRPASAPRPRAAGVGAHWPPPPPSWGKWPGWKCPERRRARPGPGGGQRRADVPLPRAAPGEPRQLPAGARPLATAARHSR